MSLESYNRDSNFSSYKIKEIKDWNYNSWVGFYEELEKELAERNGIVVNWGHVNNASGGFLGFWWHWIGLTDNGHIYLQLEESKLCVRLYAEKEKDESRRTIYKKIVKILGEKAKEEKHKDDLRIIQRNLRYGKQSMAIGSTGGS